MERERIEAITFDCYGTLIDWESGLVRALTPLLARHNLTMKEDAMLELYGSLEAQAEKGAWVPYREVLGRVVDGLGDWVGFVPQPHERAWIAESLPGWMPFPDTVQALRDLKRRFRLGIISNVDDDLFAATSRHLEVEFDWVVTAQQARAYKPARAIFETALERIGLPRASILHAAQSIYHDVVPAQALGLRTVHVNRRAAKEGFGATPPADARPDAVVPDLASLAAMLGTRASRPAK